VIIYIFNNRENEKSLSEHRHAELIPNTIFAHVYNAPWFLSKEFWNNDNLYTSNITFYLCESKIFVIAFVALGLLPAAFVVIF
jgi:hypothetical protein